MDLVSQITEVSYGPELAGHAVYSCLADRGAASVFQLIYLWDLRLYLVR
jgi:hypothetical protein